MYGIGRDRCRNDVLKDVMPLSKRQIDQLSVAHVENVEADVHQVNVL